jgi:cytochrome P450
MSPTPLRSFDDLPGPRAWPLLGNLPQIQPTRLHQQLEAWCQAHGPVFRLRLGRRMRVVVLGEHGPIAQALRDRPDGFRRTSRLQDIWTEMGLLPGVFGAHGEVWQRQRRMVMHGFDPGHVRGYHPQLQRVAQRLVARWRNAASRDAEIDLQADLMRFTVDAIAGLAFGAEVDTLSSDEDVIQRHLNRLFPILFRRVFAPLPWWRWFPDADDRALRESVPAINTAVESFIRRARERLQTDPARRSAPPNLLEAMLVAADAPGSGIDDAQVAGNVLTMLLAGEDTTANTLAWLIHLLWQHPAELARVRDEVRAVCTPDTAPSLEQLGQLEHLEACTHEAMRLKPVAPMNALQALRPTELAGVRIEPGMVVMAAMRHDPLRDELVPEAAAFRPDRWRQDGHAVAESAHHPKRISMPFGAGPRICPGRYLALVEIKTAMAALLTHFDVAHVGTADGQPPAEVLHLAMAPRGLRMRLRERA